MLSSENVDININLKLTILQAFISGVLRRYGLTDQSGLYLTDTAFSTRKSSSLICFTANLIHINKQGVPAAEGKQQVYIPSFVFPGGIRPSHTSKGTWDSKRRSEHKISSTASAATATNEASSESKGGSHSPADGKKRKRIDDETLTDQLRNSKHVAVSKMVKAGARIHLLDPFVQGPIKSDPIRKDSPENVAVISEDPPESQPANREDSHSSSS
ncbi:hypothetical protein YC2023_070434 [Brassica napus]